jgi:cytochrome c biogenesis protein ResB
MALLFVNLVVGGIVRLRRTWTRAGVLVVHLGIALMLAAGFVKLRFSDDGRIVLHEGESADWFESYYEWEIAISRQAGDGQIEEHVVPWSELSRLRPDTRGVFTSAALPFELRVSHFERSAQPVRKGPMFSVDVPVVDGWFVRTTERAKEAERDLPACYATVRFRDSGTEQSGILWGAAMHPWAVSSGGATWFLDLRRRRWPLPFEIRLEDFRKEDHPRLDMARSFESDVTMTEAGAAREVRIWMNNPLRHAGYILFQSSYSQDERGEISIFSVVRNPSDHWPLYSCIVIAIGLLLHFSRRLVRYVRSEMRGAT